MQPEKNRKALVAFAALATLSACADFGARRPSADADTTAQADRATLQAQVIANHLESLARLAQAPPAEQAEIFSAARLGYEASPTASQELRYALALALEGHGSQDATLAQKLLRELVARPESLLPAERALAFLALQGIDRRIALTEDNRRLRTEAARGERERVAAANRRLQAEVEENAKLRKALDEARAKLDAIANIERSISERKPQEQPEGRTP